VCNAYYFTGPNLDASLALDTKTLVEFLGVTQKDEWGRLNNSGDTILNSSEDEWGRLNNSTIPGTPYLILRS
jgi:hypothetical protein